MGELLRLLGDVFMGGACGLGGAGLFGLGAGECSAGAGDFGWGGAILEDGDCARGGATIV